MRREALGEIKRGGAADIVREMVVHLALELGIGLRFRVSLLQCKDERHQRLGDETAAIDAEMAALIGTGAEGIGLLDAHVQRIEASAPDIKRRAQSSA